MNKFPLLPVFSIFFIFSFLSPVLSEEESITITTYYPAPYGTYKEMRAKKMAVGNTYVENSNYCWGVGCGATVIPDAADLVVEGNVGIGTATPQAKLDVSDSANTNAGIKLGFDNSNCTSAKAGTMRYNAPAMEYCDGVSWKSMGGGGLGNWVDVTTAANNASPQGPTTTDGFIFAYTIYGGCTFKIIGYTDSSTNPSTIRNAGQNINQAGSIYGPNISMAVRKGDYWKLEKVGGCGGASIVAYWIPLGN